MTYLKETKDQRSPNTLEYVLGFRESFLPTTTSISLIMTKACGIFCSFAFETFVLSLKLISLSVIIAKSNYNKKHNKIVFDYKCS